MLEKWFAVGVVGAGASGCYKSCHIFTKYMSVILRSHVTRISDGSIFQISTCEYENACLSIQPHTQSGQIIHNQIIILLEKIQTAQKLHA